MEHITLSSIIQDNTAKRLFASSIVCLCDYYMNLNYNLNAGVITALSQNLHFSTILSGSTSEAHSHRHHCSTALLCHLFNTQYLISHADFYLTSHLATAPTQQITPLPKYHIEITTSKSTYIYTNLYTYPSSRAIGIEVTLSNSAIRQRWSADLPHKMEQKRHNRKSDQSTAHPFLQFCCQRNNTVWHRQRLSKRIQHRRGINCRCPESGTRKRTRCNQ
jgi:hypothetical protein